MEIPFIDLKVQYLSIKDEIDAAIQDVLDNTAFILGNNVERFEENFAKFCNSKYCVGVNSGTAALHLVLLAKGIGKNDEVIVPSNTFFATAEAVSLCGAKPVFVDVHEDTYNISPEEITKAITNNTKAIIPVHLYGQPVDMDPIIEIAEENGIIIIEDSCQAHDSEYKGKRIPFHTGCFSFYPGKNLGAFGEGGAIVTDDYEVAEKARLLRAHGENPKNQHHAIGYNYRMEGLQGAILDVKLNHLKKWTDMRRKNAYLYTKLIKEKGIDVVTPRELDNVRHSYHLYVIRVKNRDKVQKFLSEKGISTGIHYPIPIHRQPAYSASNSQELTVIDSFVDEILSIPIFPELTEEQINYVVDNLEKSV